MSQTSQLLELRADITPELASKLSRVGALLTQRYRKKCSLDDALDAMTEIFLDKFDPERKAVRTPRPLPSAKAPVKAPAKPAVPSHLKIEALRRDRNQCTHARSGSRCAVKKRVDIFPAKRLRDPRRATLEDVRTLCARHWAEVRPTVVR